MKSHANLSGVIVGAKQPIRFIGVINVSPESFYKSSIHTQAKTISQAANKLMKEGADIIDIGAMSTAPYLKTQISIAEEMKRTVAAIKAIRRATDVPLSIDTTRGEVALSALEAGAMIINDVSGFTPTKEMTEAMRQSNGIILMANPRWADESSLKNPVRDTQQIFSLMLKNAHKNKISQEKIVLDPGIGFFRKTRLPWWQWDLSILKNLNEFTSLNRPILIALSRKSFLGHLLKIKNPEQRLAGSLGATVMAVLRGAHMIRTHDVTETKQAVQVVQAIQKSQ